MALFKILKGAQANLPSKITEGYAYFTTDEGNFYIDVDATTRMQVNANKAFSAMKLQNGEEVIEFEDLKEVIDKAAAIPYTLIFNAVLRAANWTGSAAPYTQTITIAEMIELDTPHIIPDYSDDNAIALLEQQAWYAVSEAETANGSITFTCFVDKPTQDLNVVVKVDRKNYSMDEEGNISLSESELIEMIQSQTLTEEQVNDLIEEQVPSDAEINTLIDNKLDLATQEINNNITEITNNLITEEQIRAMIEERLNGLTFDVNENNILTVTYEEDDA